ncbi:hypothetical protein ACJD0Z_06085 [Flavobacteriaceae bacterium M23B6Z8]
MKYCWLFFLLPIIFFPLALHGQQESIEQSKPFINVLIALENDAVELFKNSFSKEINDSKDATSTWEERLKEGEEKFSERFGDYDLQDFTFTFIDSTSQLQVWFQKKEAFKIRVVKEGNEWKLNQH